MTQPSNVAPEPVPCVDCGVPIERKYGGRGQKPRRCEPCRREHLRKYNRERERRSTEVVSPCPRCGGPVDDRPRRRTPYCATCYPFVKREALALRERKLRAERGRTCKDCGAPIAFNGKQTPRRCLQCSTRRRKSLIMARQWGLSSGQYDALLAAQNYRCAICLTDNPGKRAWSVDHDHECCDANMSCGSCVRGLLCTRCNALLGHAQDDSQILLRAIEYLRHPPAKA